jgi:hypothetical protein
MDVINATGYAPVYTRYQVETIMAEDTVGVWKQTAATCEL